MTNTTEPLNDTQRLLAREARLRIALQLALDHTPGDLQENDREHYLPLLVAAVS